MPEYGTKLKHQEDETGIARYTLAYPELPPEVSKLIEGDSHVELPDYSHAPSGYVSRQPPGISYLQNLSGKEKLSHFSVDQCF